MVSIGAAIAGCRVTGRRVAIRRDSGACPYFRASGTGVPAALRAALKPPGGKVSGDPAVVNQDVVECPVMDALDESLRHAIAAGFQEI